MNRFQLEELLSFLIGHVGESWFVTDRSGGGEF